MSLTKPAGITGLDSAHPLFANIATFWEFGQLDKDLVTDTAITSTSTVVDDPDAGTVRAFAAGAALVTNTLPLNGENTILVVYKNTGAIGTGSDTTYFFDLAASDTQLRWKQQGYSSFDYEIKLESGNSGVVINRWAPYGNDQGVYAGVHATALQFTTAQPLFYQDGAEVPLVSGGATATAWTGEPYAIPVMTDVAVDGTVQLAAIVVFDKVLNASELASVTSDPWSMVLSTAGPSFAIDDVILNPGDTITITTSNWGATDPTQAVITDSQSNTLTLPLIKTGTDTYTFTMPALPATGNTAPGLLFGTDYNVEVS